MVSSKCLLSRLDLLIIYIEDEFVIDGVVNGLLRIYWVVFDGNLDWLKELVENGEEDVNMLD